MYKPRKMPYPDGTASTAEEKQFYAEVLRILSEGRHKAHAAINFAMVEAYWAIGKRIVEQEQQGQERTNYGEHLLANLSYHLSGILGRRFSVANLWNFRQFYLTWPNEEILYTLCRELGWSHIRLIMRLDTEATRNYYLNETRAQGWSVRALERNIRTGYFKRLLSSQQPIELDRNARYLREAQEKTFYTTDHS